VKTFGRNDYIYLGKAAPLNNNDNSLGDDLFLQTASSLEKKTSTQWFLIDDLIVALYCKIW
jgi:hypothetical protein